MRSLSKLSEMLVQEILADDTMRNYHRLRKSTPQQVADQIADIVARTEPDDPDDATPAQRARAIEDLKSGKCNEQIGNWLAL